MRQRSSLLAYFALAMAISRAIRAPLWLPA